MPTSSSVSLGQYQECWNACTAPPGYLRYHLHFHIHAHPDFFFLIQVSHCAISWALSLRDLSLFVCLFVGIKPENPCFASRPGPKVNPLCLPTAPQGSCSIQLKKELFLKFLDTPLEFVRDPVARVTSLRFWLNFISTSTWLVHDMETAAGHQLPSWTHANATNFAWLGHDISSPRDCDSTVFPAIANFWQQQPRDWPLKDNFHEKHPMGSVKETFLPEATSIEIWWSRLVDYKEPVCPFAGTFVMIVAGLVTWAIYTQGQLLLVVSLIIRGVVPGYKIAQVTRAPTITQTVQNELYCSVHSCFWQSGRKMDWTKVPYWSQRTLQDMGNCSRHSCSRQFWVLLQYLERLDIFKETGYFWDSMELIQHFRFLLCLLESYFNFLESSK